MAKTKTRDRMNNEINAGFLPRHYYDRRRQGYPRKVAALV